MLRATSCGLVGVFISMKSKPTAAKFPAPVYAETVLAPNFADAQKHFFQSLMRIHYAHALMLNRQRIITGDDARAILSGLDQLDPAKIRRAKYDGSVEDLFFY